MAAASITPILTSPSLPTYKTPDLMNSKIKELWKASWEERYKYFESCFKQNPTDATQLLGASGLLQHSFNVSSKKAELFFVKIAALHSDYNQTEGWFQLLKMEQSSKLLPLEETEKSLVPGNVIRNRMEGPLLHQIAAIGSHRVYEASMKLLSGRQLEVIAKIQILEQRGSFSTSDLHSYHHLEGNLLKVIIASPNRVKDDLKVFLGKISLVALKELVESNRSFSDETDFSQHIMSMFKTLAIHLLKQTKNVPETFGLLCLRYPNFDYLTADWLKKHIRGEIDSKELFEQLSTPDRTTKVPFIVQAAGLKINIKSLLDLLTPEQQDKLLTDTLYKGIPLARWLYREDRNHLLMLADIFINRLQKLFVKSENDSCLIDDIIDKEHPGDLSSILHSEVMLPNNFLFPMLMETVPGSPSPRILHVLRLCIDEEVRPYFSSAKIAEICATQIEGISLLQRLEKLRKTDMIDFLTKDLSNEDLIKYLGPTYVEALSDQQKKQIETAKTDLGGLISMLKTAPLYQLRLLGHTHHESMEKLFMDHAMKEPTAIIKNADPKTPMRWRVIFGSQKLVQILTELELPPEMITYPWLKVLKEELSDEGYLKLLHSLNLDPLKLLHIPCVVESLIDSQNKNLKNHEMATVLLRNILTSSPNENSWDYERVFKKLYQFIGKAMFLECFKSIVTDTSSDTPSGCQNLLNHFPAWLNTEVTGEETFLTVLIQKENSALLMQFIRKFGLNWLVSLSPPRNIGKGVLDCFTQNCTFEEFEKFASSAPAIDPDSDRNHEMQKTILDLFVRYPICLTNIYQRFSDNLIKMHEQFGFHSWFTLGIQKEKYNFVIQMHKLHGPAKCWELLQQEDAETQCPIWSLFFFSQSTIDEGPATSCLSMNYFGYIIEHLADIGTLRKFLIQHNYFGYLREYLDGRYWTIRIVKSEETITKIKQQLFNINHRTGSPYFHHFLDYSYRGALQSLLKIFPKECLRALNTKSQDGSSPLIHKYPPDSEVNLTAILRWIALQLCNFSDDLSYYDTLVKIQKDAVDKGYPPHKDEEDISQTEVEILTTIVHEWGTISEGESPCLLEQLTKTKESQNKLFELLMCFEGTFKGTPWEFATQRERLHHILATATERLPEQLQSAYKKWKEKACLESH